MPAAETARGAAGGGSHGPYPPMGASGAGQQGQERRRSSFLIDDSGAFDVSHVPCTDPVIGEPEARS